MNTWHRNLRLNKKMFVAAVALVMQCWTAQGNAAPQRIVSLNLCADQYLIALADSDQIAALTDFSRNPGMSFFAKEAADLPVSAGSGEEILSLDPDLIILSPYRRLETRALISQFNFPILEIGTARSFEEIARQTREIATAIGHPERGAKLIQKMRRELEALQKSASDERSTALHYQRRGFLTGEKSLMTEIMQRAGLINLAAQVSSGAAIKRVSLETLLNARPDFIVTTELPGTVKDIGTELLEHPSLKKFYGTARRLYIPEHLTVCGGPYFPKAVSTLRAQIENQTPSITHSAK